MIVIAKITGNGAVYKQQSNDLFRRIYMGVTLKCKKTNRYLDMGYFGFNRLREKVAELAGEPFASHYKKLSTAQYVFSYGETRDRLFAAFDTETEAMLKRKVISEKVASFLLQSDCEGKLRYGGCIELLKVIKDYDDNVHYGYVAGRDKSEISDFALFRMILQNCVKTKSTLIWN